VNRHRRRRKVHSIDACAGASMLARYCQRRLRLVTQTACGSCAKPQNCQKPAAVTAECSDGWRVLSAEESAAAPMDFSDVAGAVGFVVAQTKKPGIAAGPPHGVANSAALECILRSRHERTASRSRCRPASYDQARR
jgi:hypothetical protein